MITNSCVLEHIRTLPDKSVNTTFSDFPYFMGTEWHYVNDRLQMKGQGKDFMHGSANSWEINNADWWREYFKNLYRVMKFGGYVCFWCIDRQSFAFKTLMLEAGFEVEHQTLLWANISNFPKSSSASKMIDRSLGIKNESSYIPNFKNKNYGKGLGGGKTTNITAPATALSKLFENHKYGKAPFKKITEPLLIFRKAPKNGSVLNDLIAFENDSEISPAVVDIENNRVGIDTITTQGGNKNGSHNVYNKIPDFIETSHTGRFPCTLFNDKASAELLDSQLDKISFELNGKIYERKRRIEYQQILWQHTQNGTLQSFKVLNCEREELHSGGSDGNRNEQIGSNNFTLRKKNISTKGGLESNSGFLSCVMHTADFTEDDYDSLVSALNAYSNGINQDTYYEPTVSPKERNLGCENLLYKGIEYIYVLKKSKKGKDTRTKFTFDEIVDCDIESLGKTNKDIEKAFVKLFYDLVCEISENEITDINFVEIATETKEYENENAGFYLLENGTFKVFAGAKELILQVENVIRKGNGHPTLKPISIGQHFLSLFRLSQSIKQTLYIPFSGAGSEIIGAIQAGYNIDNIIACEINPDYVEIAKHRIEYYQSLQPKVRIEKQVGKLQPAKNSLFPVLL